MSEKKSISSEKDWREIAEQAAKETNPQKLARMVGELCGALDKRNQHNQSQSTPPIKKSA
jgi:hypothetical protein